MSVFFLRQKSPFLFKGFALHSSAASTWPPRRHDSHLLLHWARQTAFERIATGRQEGPEGPCVYFRVWVQGVSMSPSQQRWENPQLHWREEGLFCSHWRPSRASGSGREAEAARH